MSFSNRFPLHRWVLFASFFLVVILLTACGSNGSGPLVTPSPSAMPFTPSATYPAPTRASATPTRPTATPRPSATLTVSASPSPEFQTTPYGPDQVDIPVLMYHRILANNQDDPRYAVTTENFTHQIALLQARGYHTISVAELSDAMRNGRDLPANPIVITFDDGYAEVFTKAYPILKDAGYTATAYLIVDEIDQPGYLSAARIRSLAHAGWEIGSHTLSHANLNDDPQAIAEVCTSRKSLQHLTGQSIVSIAYPYGLANHRVMQLVQDCGYTSGAGVGILNVHTLEHVFYFSRREVEGGFSLADFAGLLAGPTTPTPDSDT